MGKKFTDMNLRTADFIYPYFVTGGKNKKEEINSFPGIFRFSLDRLLSDIGESRKLGLNKILLFGIPDTKDARGTTAYKEDNIVSLAVEGIKKRFPALIVMTDVCLCAYTTHGHCGILKAKSAKRKAQNGVNIDNKNTLETLSNVAISHAEAGADWVAPSAMARGQVRAIRSALDKNGYNKVKIMGYSAKFASNFYGPFRQAANSAPAFGDRKGYQLDYNDAEAAIKRIGDDIREGAGAVMVKPALAYLDVVKQAKLRFKHPLAAYNVSGEYSMVKYGAKSGLWDERKMVFETIGSIKRAGADLIITYHAKDIARWLRE
ncbi:MAG: porphobilinogen synthase [Candidatus Omnitrophica bacterium]|nr:porphobilinogen synthase [Candidatus Omnitrophota bacterium]